VVRRERHINRTCSERKYKRAEGAGLLRLCSLIGSLLRYLDDRIFEDGGGRVSVPIVCSCCASVACHKVFRFFRFPCEGLASCLVLYACTCGGWGMSARAP
jgi:hypothetical protein